MNITPTIRRAIHGLRRVAVAGQSFLLLALRLIYGGQFVMTGYGKLTHLDNVTSFFTNLGIPAPGFNAALVGTTEMVGGALLVIGLGTRLAAIPLIISMTVAYLTAHADEAFKSLEAFTDQAPYQFLLASLILMAFGAGRLSCDTCIARWFYRGGDRTDAEAKEHLASAAAS